VTEDEKTPDPKKVVSIDDFRKTPLGKTLLGSNTSPGPQKIANGTSVAPATPAPRRYFIELQDDILELTGVLILTNYFLALADSSGHVLFAAAQGEWVKILDVTGTDVTLADFIGAQEE